MNIVLTLIVLILGWVAYQGALIVHATHISKTLFANTKAYEQHPANPHAHILIAGDSTGVGVGAGESGSIGWRIGQDYLDADITNVSVSGARLAAVIQNLKPLAAKHYQLVLLQVGANDITGFTSLQTLRTQLQEALTIANKLSDRVVVMTAGNVGNAPVFKWPASKILEWRTLQVREIFMTEVAKQSGVYVDLFKERKDDVFNTDIKRYYAPDQFHPSADGYGVWYEQLKKATTDLPI